MLMDLTVFLNLRRGTIPKEVRGRRRTMAETTLSLDPTIKLHQP
jgi:hypothetical protein